MTRRNSSRCQKPTQVLAGWPEEEIQPTTAKIAEVSLDDILESSLVLSLDEIQSAHITQMEWERTEALERAKRAQRDEAEAHAKRIENAQLQAQALEDQRRRERLSETVRRVRTEAKNQARVLNLVRKEDQERRLQEAKNRHEDERIIAAGETRSEKRTLRTHIRLAGVLCAAAALLVGWNISEHAEAHTDAMAALSSESEQAVDEAQRRIAALETQIEETRAGEQSRLRDLHVALNDARQALSKATEEAEIVAAGPQPRRQPGKRIVTRSAPPSPVVAPRPARSDTRATGPSVASTDNATYDSGEQCLAHDPMCFDL